MMARHDSMKRLFDLVGALAGLLALWPLFAILAWIIRRETPGPAFYTQPRIGLGGASYRIWKFRSMIVGAQSVGPATTTPSDSRITRVGRVLRKLSLDELPQLFNVLRGEMSLVGPRPEQPFQRANYSAEEWVLRHRVRPGLTGWAQVNGRHTVDAVRRKEMDLRYAREAGLALDLRTLVLTLREIFLRGSY
jgi:lipopolysaccharide/colanic/teichoic acid biosynthesis glycosyltransferase